jgi:carbonic anhydrase
MNALSKARLLSALSCGLVLCPLGLTAAPKEAQDAAIRLLRDASLMLLKEGNDRYVMGKSQHPHLDAERRSSTGAQGQEPFATILACSDSRDPVELIFDRGVGDLFVIRVAGNVAGVSELATVEYGAGHLSIPVLVVMGHTRCGAVTAVVKGTELHGHLLALAEKIRPAAAKAKAEGADGDDLVAKAIQGNVWQTIEDIIQQSSVVRERINAGRLNIFGAVYDLEAGKVNWLGAHPAEDALVALADQAQTDLALARKLSAPEPGPRPSRPPPAVSTGSGRALAPVVQNESPAGERHSEPPAPSKVH